MVTLLEAFYLYLEAGRAEDADAIAERGMAAEPESQQWRFRVAQTRLALGDYERGWPLYEARRWAFEPINVPPFNFPEWRGEPIERLLVWYEQGFGDQIMFARWIPVLEARGIAVRFACRPPLARLFRAAGLDAYPIPGASQIPACDAWCLVGSLPLILGGLPPPIPLAGGEGRGVGFVGAGRPTHPNDANRSMPPDIIEEMRAHTVSLAPEDTGAEDFEATRRIIAGLERVVTVDTAMAHLAGSMGKPTTVIVPRIRTDWRWGRQGERTPWYPSIRIIRLASQDADGWREALRQALPVAA